MHIRTVWPGRLLPQKKSLPHLLADTTCNCKSINQQIWHE